MAENGRELTSKQEKALAALLAEPSIEAAAKSSGVSARQMHRYLADDAFRSAYDRARSEAFGAALSSLQVGAGDAAALLREFVRDAELRPSDRLAAAVKLLGLALRARELREIEERLSDIERRLEKV